MDLIYFILLPVAHKPFEWKPKISKWLKIDRIVGGREATTRGLATWTQSVNGEELRNYKITEIYNYFDSNKVAPLLL